MINSKLVSLDRYHARIAEVMHNVHKVMIGKEKIVELTLVAILAKGHILLEDVPGVGKTMLVRSLARSLGCSFKRIQFTPDLLPSDVTGVSIFNQKELCFEFRPGPIFGHIVLADEINRTSPKTQAALLEAMEEGSVTVDGKTRLLPSPFLVMATQNPIEYEGTYPLPEAQMDRFLLKLKLGYPGKDEEIHMLSRVQQGHPIDQLDAVMSVEELLKLQQEVRQVHVEDSVKEYIVSLVRATREHPSVYLGASPRGSIALLYAAQALAFIRGRDYCIPDDVKLLAPYTLGHRLILTSEARLNGASVEQVIDDVLGQIRVPVVEEALKS
ncbi:ATPase associated with various cellular activities AAA_3 [Caldalkalibacillus thermarum TA2.A1]|uniref:ATPase associated with various cellular activities AAA_3 n=1 Tax=Caldalkalibacillus thermarum (strain TA2.A1) TaxID=986075 RepID=F5L6Q1_CALTT|nr:MoxR family ATPase [Caldalkalibacillus thermarum]EGL83002.1 ATPase associated with various cellular activities AAA_3 [Caldalkalibacillus thermarum TA2.A1]QZT34596.1 MoxR family ATPase [Caldalkalibacillus thermarum TA2.A1]